MLIKGRVIVGLSVGIIRNLDMRFYVKIHI